MMLRPYQKKAIEKLYNHLRNKKNNPCIVLPTGTGKSHIIAQVVSDVVKKWNGRILILAHVKELLQQNAEKIKLHAPDIDIGIYSAGLGKRDIKESVIVAGIQSVYKIADKLDKFNLILIDEAHLIPPEGDGMYRKFLSDSKIINPRIRVIGLTATPYRLKGGLICTDKNILNEICFEANIKDMIKNGYLSKLKSKTGIIKPDFKKLHKRGGEFIKNEIAELMDRTLITDKACHEIIELTKNRNSVLIFTSGVKHCEHVKNKLKELTSSEIEMITGETLSSERAEIIERFKNNEIKSGLFGEEKNPVKYLCNVNVLTTGFDAPNVDCVVLLRPTASPGLYVQMVGRGTRIFKNKDDCLILDYGGNIARHGTIDSISIIKKEKGNGIAPTKECPTCLFFIHASFKICPECGYKFPENETKIDNQAANEEILSGKITDIEYEVKDVSYFIHSKKGAKENDPKTLKVNYSISILQSESEWVCPEHSGYARGKFIKWWQNRSNTPIPKTVAQALSFANRGLLAKPEKIIVRTVSGERFSRIIKYINIGEKPFYEREPGEDDEPETENKINDIINWDEVEIPF